MRLTLLQTHMVLETLIVQIVLITPMGLMETLIQINQLLILMLLMPQSYMIKMVITEVS